MKKNIKLTLLLILLVISLTGCVKFNSTMEIKKNKSMDYTVIYAFDKSLFGNQEILSSDDKKELEDKGFKVSNYVDGSMTGFKVSKNIKNIDSVSSINNSTYDLSGLLDSSKSENKIFKLKKGLFKNTYIASFKFDSTDGDLNNSTNDTTIDNDFSISNDTTSDSDFDFSNINTNMDLSFNVKLPYKAISSNATTKSNNDKNLSWNLSSTGEDNIEFSFSLYNMTTIYISVGVILLLIIIIIVILLKKKKNTQNKKENEINSQNTKDNASNVTPVINNENTLKETVSQQTTIISQPTTFSTTTVDNKPENEILSTNYTTNQVFPQKNQATDIFSTTSVNNNANEILSTDAVENKQSDVNNNEQIDTL